MSEIIEDEARDPTLAYIAKLETRIIVLEAALKLDAHRLWLRAALTPEQEAEAITCVGGGHVYPRIERLEAENADHAASHARIEELKAVLREILDGHPDAFDLARKAIAPEQKK